MSQSAAKEPTMDEILSSIRQIIADDDESAAQRMPVAAVKAPTLPVQPQASQVIDPFSDDDDDDFSALALSPEQIVNDAIAEDEIEEPVVVQPVAAPVNQKAEALAPVAAEMVLPDDIAFAQDDDVPPAPQAQPAPIFSKAAPMPDADLSADLAEELLEPATTAAIASTFSKLNTPRITPETPLTVGGLTVEGMIREMMRPMLKDWLEENLPSMVERIVTQEIERISRG